MFKIFPLFYFQHSSISISSLFPGINIEVINLRRNWQKLKQSSNQSMKDHSRVGSGAGDNIELTYYTLSGKEVNVRDDRQSRPVSVRNNFKKPYLKQ